MLASIILSSLVILVDVRKVYGVPPAACFAPFRWDDCGKEPKPVMYYWKPGSRCEVGMWRGCLPNINMFPDEYECVATCIFSMRAGMEDYHSFNELEKDSDETTRDPYDIYYKDTTLTDELNDTAANDTDVSEGGTTEGGEDGNTTTAGDDSSDKPDAGGTDDKKPDDSKPDDSKPDDSKPDSETPDATTPNADESGGKEKLVVTLTPPLLRKSLAATPTPGALTEKVTFKCDECTLEVGDVTCNNGLGKKADVVTVGVTDKDITIGITAFVDTAACVCMGTFKFGEKGKVQKLLAAIDNADATVVTAVEKPVETEVGDAKEFAVGYTCAAACTVEKVTENGELLTENTGYRLEKGKIIFIVKKEAKEFEGAYQVVFKGAAPTDVVTKTVLEIGLPPAPSK